MLDAVLPLLAKVFAAGLFLIAPTLASRWGFNHVCAFKVTWLRAYAAFACAGAGLFAWDELVSSSVLKLLHGSSALLIEFVRGVRWLGSFGIVVGSIGYIIRDPDGKPIGLRPAIVVLLLTLVCFMPFAAIAALALCAMWIA